jgi:hypothetical protein
VESRAGRKVPSITIYVINIEPLSGKRFAAYAGNGSLSFREVRLSSIRVKSEDMAGYFMPLGLGWGGFDLAFFDEEKAHRVERALLHLARLCGARDDPF